MSVMMERDKLMKACAELVISYSYSLKAWFLAVTECFLIIASFTQVQDLVLHQSMRKGVAWPDLMASFQNQLDKLKTQAV